MIPKLKKLLLDERHQSERKSKQQAKPSKPAQRTSRKNSRRSPQTGNSRIHPSLYLIAVFSIAVVVFIVLGSKKTDVEIDLEETLCPTKQHITRKTYLLIDLSETLLGTKRTALQNLLNVVAENLITREQLSISQMHANAYSPRREVQRFCNPDLSDIEGGYGKRIASTDCKIIIADEFIWPPGFTDQRRQDIKNTCNVYTKIQEKVVEASDRYSQVNPAERHTYIVGSIEDIMHEVNEYDGRAANRLIIFSDMLQNANWFSQYPAYHHGDWTFTNLAARRKNVAYMGAIPDNNFAEVLLCYLPNPGILNTAKKRRQHRQLWNRYFAPAKVHATDYNQCVIEAKSLMRAR